MDHIFGWIALAAGATSAGATTSHYQFSYWMRFVLVIGGIAAVAFGARLI